MMNQSYQSWMKSKHSVRRRDMTLNTLSYWNHCDEPGPK